jgi:multiple sugar transport system permease protein
MAVKIKIQHRILIWFLLIVLLIVAIFPLYWIINTSFKLDTEIYIKKPTFFPQTFTLRGYKYLFQKLGFLSYLKNSAIVSIIVPLISVFIASITAYSIARLRFRKRQQVSQGIFYAYLMPKTVLYIPLYMVAASLRVTNSIWSLVLIYPTMIIPYATWMLITYFKTIPYSIEESALMDGATRIRSMFQIILPLATPGILATLIFSFTFCWNEYLYALVMITKTAQKTIPLGLSDLIVDDLFNWGPLMGGAFIASIPVVGFYYDSSKNLKNGIKAGSLKQK